MLCGGRGCCFEVELTTWVEVVVMATGPKISGPAEHEAQESSSCCANAVQMWRAEVFCRGTRVAWLNLLQGPIFGVARPQITPLPHS